MVSEVSMCGFLCCFQAHGNAEPSKCRGIARKMLTSQQPERDAVERGGIKDKILFSKAQWPASFSQALPPNMVESTNLPVG